MEIGRFAPTTSGRAHPGTLLAGLLAMLDTRSRRGKFILRLEDIDPSAGGQTSKAALLDDLEWFGLEWDELVWQSSRRLAHEAALDRLAERGVLYECRCSRTIVKSHGLVSAAGGWVYPGTCRHRSVRDWRATRGNLRVNLAGFRVEVADEAGTDLSQTIDSAMGDPLVRRAGGGVTYQLAVVVDDAESGVTRIVRGRDIAASTATQVALRRLLGYPVPVYRHHFLLLETQGQKLAKLHQSVGADVLRQFYRPEELRVFLQHLARVPSPFEWTPIRTDDVVVTWDGRGLSLGEVCPPPVN